MRRLAVLIAVLAFAPAAHAARTPPPYAGQCGLPATQPIWFEYGWPLPAINSLFGKPGINVGAGSGAYPASMRAAGAATVYFDLNFNKRVGTTTKPADPSTMAAKAQSLFTYAQGQTGCQTPVIVLNELSGPGLVTPWSDNNAQYRQNALTFVQDLAALGAHPVLLVPTKPYTGGDALVWWQQVAASAEIVREDYVPATLTWKNGPVLGNRSLRTAYRNAIADFTGMGIPPSKLGLMVSFATTKGFGGRNGLEPDAAWYQVAKWQALSAQQVAAETGIASVWSWGWGEWNAPEQDPTKPYAACAWLWVRSTTFCNAPKIIGKSFDSSRTEGQLSALTPGIQCVVGKQSLSDAAIANLQRITGDRDTAYSALFERIVEQQQMPVSQFDVLGAEHAVIAQAFGTRAAYLKALSQAHATVAIARGVLADELRRAKVEATLSASPPSASAVQTFYTSYPDLSARLVKASPAPIWLGGKAQGLAISEVAPDRLFTLPTGSKSTVRTTLGLFAVQPLDDALPLGAVPLGKARPAIVAALKTFARGQAFEKWTVSKQRVVQNTATCRGDDLPQPAAIDLTQYLPFLRLG
jgi:hypothetical protein